MSAEASNGESGALGRDFSLAWELGRIVDVEGEITPELGVAYRNAVFAGRGELPLIVRFNTYGGEASEAIALSLYLGALREDQYTSPCYALIDGPCQSAGMMMVVGAPVFDGILAMRDSRLRFHYLTDEEWQGARAPQDFFWQLIFESSLAKRNPAMSWSDWLKVIQASTEYTAEEALAIGLIDGIVDVDDQGKMSVACG